MGSNFSGSDQVPLKKRFKIVPMRYLVSFTAMELDERYSSEAFVEW